MRNIFSPMRVAIGAAAIVAFAVTMSLPTPASAGWYRSGWGWHPGWHHGWHYGWRGCCWGPRVVVGLAPPVVAVPAPVVYGPRPVAPGQVWIPPYPNGP
jgi:hypothetical protein